MRDIALESHSMEIEVILCFSRMNLQLRRHCKSKIKEQVKLYAQPFFLRDITMKNNSFKAIFAMIGRVLYIHMHVFNKWKPGCRSQSKVLIISNYTFLLHPGLTVFA